MTLKGKTLFITGASRGIGKAIALRAARDGANVAIVAKTAEPHPKLPGTVYDAAREVESAGGRALPCITDVRFEDQVAAAVARTVEAFGGIDIVVNNASAISLTPTAATEMKRFDLMQAVNVRATFLCTKLALPALERAENPHVLMLSPPLSLEPRWYGAHLAYTLSKMGMSQCVLGFAEEFRSKRIAVNALWPKTAIATAAVQNLLGGDAIVRRSRKVEIVSDAAHLMLCRKSTEFSGRFCIDEDVLREAGVSDFDQYAVDPAETLLPDFFL
jgi:citronellol/citronellal dehydrogenase